LFFQSNSFQKIIFSETKEAIEKTLMFWYRSLLSIRFPEKEYSDIPFFEPISKVDFPSEIKKRPKLPFVHFRMEIDVQHFPM
jgi:hypothetical protein